MNISAMTFLRLWPLTASWHLCL